MGNSPSKSNYAISSTKTASATTSNGLATGSDELNSNEPNDPDDSRPLPTINSQHINLPARVAPGEPKNKSPSPSSSSPTHAAWTPHSPAPRTLSQTRHNKDKSGKKRASASHDIEIDMSFAKALGPGYQGPGSSSSSSSGSSSGSSNSSSMTPPSYSTDSSFLNYSFNENEPQTPGSNTMATSTTHPLPPIKEEMQASATLARKNRSGRSNAAQVPHDRKAAPPVIIKRYAHDSHSTECLDIDDVIEKLLEIGGTRYYQAKEFPLSTWKVQLICAKARELFLEQPSLLRLQAPIKIVGDVHGQFTDLMRILKLSGVPSDSSYLFLGDYVDRGKQSLETMLLLLCYKIKFPDRFYMLRGNHESANVTKMYGFYDECKRRLTTKSWKMFVDVFNSLPLAAVVQDKIFCVHGGISPHLRDLRQIERVVRPTDIPDEGLITDLLWSDPDPQVSDWSTNDRGVSVTFSKRNVLDFCSRFNFDLVIRGHMVVEDGYEFFARKKLVTVFSAPNYCGEFQNWGAVMSVTTGLMCSFELLKPHGVKNKSRS
ncbi:LANO_0F01244g1_1 [Lachancea nothofagi CBS 11611]|uniref:Serine/threonine-protein phosphatase n=1 Tax=Lachancea nothofagi CBS 11611 TaxID=1266666 RepID=A0A1G4K610_9SACH|nr:LANO_0F01244g1_1 [Lachancea nothofagi CBS 11611]